MAEDKLNFEKIPNLKPKSKLSANASVKKIVEFRKKMPAIENKILGTPLSARSPAASVAQTPAPGPTSILAGISSGIKIIPAAEENKTPFVPAATTIPLKQKPAKPQVEGINAPYSSPPLVQVPKLTAAEVKIIKETDGTGKIFSPQITKSGSVQNIKLQGPKKNFWPYIILIILAGGFLLWKFTGLGASINNYLSSNNKTQVIQSKPSNQINTAPAFNPSTSPETQAVTPTSTAPNVEPITPPVSAIPETKLKVTTTPTNYLNVRTQPSLAGTIITKVHPGETYVYSETQNGWYHITLADGSLGWVSGRYIAKVN